MGIFQARILEWVAISSPGDLPHPGIKTKVPGAPALQELQETLVLFLVWEDPLKEEMVTNSGILAWRTPWTQEPVGYSP